MGHFALSQDLPLKCWDTSHCPKTLPFKCWDTPHCPKTSHSNVGTHRTVPRPLHSSVGTLHTVPRLPTQVLRHSALSQGCLLKYLDSSYCPQKSSFQCWDSRHCPKTSQSSVGTLRTVPRPPTQILGHFALSQDLPLKCWDTSHCPKTLPFKCWDTPHCPKTSHSNVGTHRTVPRPLHSSVGTLHTVPRLPTQVLRHSALSQGCLLKYLDSSYCPQKSSFQCWDSRISFSSVLGHLDHYRRYPHLSPSVENSPKPNLTDQNFYLMAPCNYFLLLIQCKSKCDLVTSVW